MYKVRYEPHQLHLDSHCSMFMQNRRTYLRCKCIVSHAYIIMLLVQVFKLVEAKKTVTPRFYLMRIMPVGLFMALTLHFGNLVYLYLTVSFIQMLKVCSAH